MDKTTGIKNLSVMVNTLISREPVGYVYHGMVTIFLFYSNHVFMVLVTRFIIYVFILYVCYHSKLLCCSSDNQRLVIRKRGICRLNFLKGF